jgi:hypothetical protein
MSRSVLSLYRLDRPSLARLSARLREVLILNDRSGLSELLELDRDLAGQVELTPRAVDLLLLPEAEPDAAPLAAALRRAAQRAALERVWRSDSPSLEGRLRAYDVLREEPEIAEPLDRLLDAGLLPWFLRPQGATGGWLEDSERAALAGRMEALAPALPVEVNAFIEALGGMEGDALVHDRL